MKKLLAIVLVVCLSLGISGVSTAALTANTNDVLGIVVVGERAANGFDEHEILVTESGWYRFNWVHGWFQVRIFSSDRQLLEQFTVSSGLRPRAVFLEQGRYFVHIITNNDYELRIERTEPPSPWLPVLFLAGAVIVTIVLVIIVMVLSRI